MKHLPLYMLRRLAMPGGTRLSKFVPWVTPIKPRSWLSPNRPCEVCGEQVLLGKIHGVDQLIGTFRGNSYYHMKCFESIPGGWREEKPKVEKGNLDKGDYRYWIGTRYALNSLMSWGMCRCCRLSTHSSEERIKHLNDDKCAVDGNRCSARLINAYRELLASTLCIVCKANRYGRAAWGVPICSIACEQTWMFSHDRYIPLEAQLMIQQKKADFFKKQKEAQKTRGEFTPIANWCLTCKMRTDQVGHDERHARWEEMGLGI